MGRKTPILIYKTQCKVFLPAMKSNINISLQFYCKILLHMLLYINLLFHKLNKKNLIRAKLPKQRRRQNKLLQPFKPQEQLLQEPLPTTDPETCLLSIHRLIGMQTLLIMGITTIRHIVTPQQGLTEIMLVQ